jgi:hypothetical protein
VTIEGLPKLAAFAWTQLGETSQIAILGGTNGSIMSDELLIVDLKTLTCVNVAAAYPFYTCCGHLIYRQDDNSIYSFGGVNSAGVNYKLKLDEKEWVECDKRHSLVANQPSMELANNSGLYFRTLEVQLQTQ